MRRRDFGGVIVGAAFMPVAAARAQQAAMPVVGFVHSASPSYVDRYARAVRQGLNETGYIEGQTVAIEYRVAEGRYDRLPGLVAELVGRKVAVILAAGGSEPAKAAKAASATIPIVFVTAGDPVKAGLVASLNRPGGNITGVSLLGSELEAKRLEMLSQLVPAELSIGVLINPKYPDADRQQSELQEAAGILKRQIHIVRASTESEIDTAVATVVQNGAGALLVAQDPFLALRREQLVALAARYKLPAIYPLRDFAEIGGLVSYSTDFREGYRQAGIYVGKILNGANPADLPVVQPTRFELVINLRTAKALGLEIPPNLLARVDEIIE
jgi:putative ABC transport system substrate-binding protein